MRATVAGVGWATEKSSQKATLAAAAGSENEQLPLLAGGRGMTGAAGWGFSGWVHDAVTRRSATPAPRRQDRHVRLVGAWRHTNLIVPPLPRSVPANRRPYHCDRRRARRSARANPSTSEAIERARSRTERSCGRGLRRRSQTTLRRGPRAVRGRLTVSRRRPDRAQPRTVHLRSSAATVPSLAETVMHSRSGGRSASGSGATGS